MNSLEHSSRDAHPAAHRPLILASTSRYRRELLSRIAIEFGCIAPEVDETTLPGEGPAQAAERLALAKARAVARSNPGAIVIGSDQTASIDGIHSIGKPGTAERAREQLRAASGKSVTFNTAVAIVCIESGIELSRLVPTIVRFRQLTEAKINAYLARENALDCAGAAKCEGLGIALLEAIESPDQTALIGLPLIAVTSMLETCGYSVL